MHVAASTPTRRYRWAPALFGIAAFALFTSMAWSSTRRMSWERPIISAVDHVPIPFHSFWITMFQGAPFALLVVIAAIAGAARGRVRVAVSGLVGCVVALALAELVFKPLVDRHRMHIAGIHRYIRVGSAMFPSAHVTAAAAFTMFVWLLLDRSARVAPFLALIPLVVAGTVLREQLHYPADVIGGMLLGSIVVYAAVAFTDVAMATTSDDSADETSPVREDLRRGHRASQ